MSSKDPVVILKPRNDKRDYRWLQLQNHLQVLLISDVDTDKAAASMDVNVGYFCDPDDLPGLAHFLEHMLFYSSEKYPEEDSYSKFIGEHGGKSNAYTSAEHTNFQFDVNFDHLEEALDRFAQFFLCPLFSPDATSREIKSVDSEHSKNVTSDPWRINQLQKHISSTKHPFHKFGTGYLKTLQTDPTAKGVDVRQKMIDFYNTHYSANLMRLVVYGREPLDTLQSLVKEKFAGVRNTGRAVPTFPGQPCEKEHLKIIIKAVPITEGHSLELSWTFLPEFRHYKAAPSRYISHLLGHEGDGSVFAILKKLGLANSLCAGEGNSGRDYAFFTVSLDLTDKGQEEMEEVVRLVSQYIEILQKRGGEEWIFEEERAVCETKFHFRDMIQPFQYVTTLSANLQMYPPEDCISGPLLPRYFDKDLINEALGRLNLDNVRMMWCSKDFEAEATSKEPWYGTEYSILKISDDLVERWTKCPPDSRLHLPAPNLFIPTDFSLKEPVPVIKYPVLHRETPFSRLWYKPDHIFRTPKAYICIDFVCPLSYTSPENSILTRIFTKMLIDYLNEYAYYAEIAGLNYTVQHSVSGFLVTVTGYNHKLLTLAEMIIEKIVNFQVNKERFDILKEKVSKDFQNFKYEQPYQQAMYAASVMLEQKRWHMFEYLDVISDVEASDLTELVPRLLSRVFLECFVTGNLSVSEAEGVVERVEKMLTDGTRGLKTKTRALFPSQHMERRVIKLETGDGFYYSIPGLNASNENSALHFYLQVGQDNCRLNVLGQLFVQTAKRDAYYQLRSVEQLGYVVFLLPRNDFGVTGMQFILQSNVKAPDVLEERVEAFLSSFKKKLDEMTDDEFQTHVDSLVAIKLEKHKNLAEEASVHWREIDDGSMQFDRMEREVEALQQLKKIDLEDFYMERVAWGGSSRQKLSIRITSGCATRAAVPLAVANATSAVQPASSLANGGSPQIVGYEGSFQGREEDQNGNAAAILSLDGELAALIAEESSLTPKGKMGQKQKGMQVAVTDIYTWKRSQQLYESLKGRHSTEAAILL